MKVGVIGLGAMGSAIAANLIAAGHQVTVYNRTAIKAEALVEQGARLAAKPAEAATGDVVITMVIDDEALRQVVFDDGAPDSFLSQQGSETIHVSMSTVSPDIVRKIDEASQYAGKKFISAPVMGRPDVAKNAQLIVMPAGDPELVERCRPLFEAIGKSIRVVGNRPEQANVSKLACNFMISSMIETLAEAFALVRKNNVDHHKFLDLVAEFFQSPIYAKYGKIIADGEFNTGAFTIAAQEKDTRLALDAAIASKVPMPFCVVIENAFLSAIGRGKGSLDPCALGELAAENAGL